MARNYSNIAADATLSASVTAIQTTMTISDDTGWPAAPFTMKIEDEVVLVGARTGTSLSSVTRGYDGTFGAIHASGTDCWPVAVALDFSGTFLLLEGGTLTGNLDMGGGVLSNPADPTAGTHVGDRDYNDGRYLGISNNAVSASVLATSRTISLTGDVTGSTSFDGSANVSITAVVGNNSHTHTDSTIDSLNASATTAGTFAIARIPTGTTSSTVSLGNHTHSYLPLTGGSLSGGLQLTGAGDAVTLTNDSGAVNIQFQTGTTPTTNAADHVRWRFGGTSTPAGMVICNYDTAAIWLKRNGDLVFQASPSLAGGVGDYTAFWDDDYFSTSVGWHIGTTASDASIKDNIRDMAPQRPALYDLRLREWEVADANGFGRHRVGETRRGVVAQEVEQVAPHLVGESGGIKRIKDGQPLQWEILLAIKDLHERISELEAMLP